VRSRLAWSGAKRTSARLAIDVGDSGKNARYQTILTLTFEVWSIARCKENRTSVRHTAVRSAHTMPFALQETQSTPPRPLHRKLA
jgi:hypothetical protein